MFFFFLFIGCASDRVFIFLAITGNCDVPWHCFEVSFSLLFFFPTQTKWKHENLFFVCFHQLQRRRKESIYRNELNIHGWNAIFIFESHYFVHKFILLFVFEIIFSSPIAVNLVAYNSFRKVYFENDLKLKNVASHQLFCIIE